MKADVQLYSHLSDTTFKLMQRIDGRLDRYTDRVLVQCGYEELIEKSLQSRDRLMDFIALEIEKLVQKTGTASDKPANQPTTPRSKLGLENGGL